MASKGKPFKQPRNGQVIFGKNLKPVIEFCNAILNGEIVNGASNEFIVGDRKVIWKIKSANSPGGGDSSYRGEYDPTGATQFGSGAFSFGDIVRVSPVNAVAIPAGTVIPGFYICVQDDPGETDLPNHPLSDGGETAFWHWMSTWPTVRMVCNDAGDLVEAFVDAQDNPT